MLHPMVVVGVANYSIVSCSFARALMLFLVNVVHSKYVVNWPGGDSMKTRTLLPVLQYRQMTDQELRLSLSLFGTS